MLVHCRVAPSIKFTGTHLYTWVEIGTVRVKCLAQEHNTMSMVGARAQTTRSRDERTNIEATTPVFFFINNNDMNEFFKRIFKEITALLNSYKCSYIGVSSCLFRDYVCCLFSYSFNHFLATHFLVEVLSVLARHLR